MSIARKFGLERTSDITEARYIARLSVDECIELCDISPRTWQRWCKSGAPKWAIRLILSCCGTLDRFGWRDWEIRGEKLYFNQLHHRYHWDPVRLIMPLYGYWKPCYIDENGDNLPMLTDGRTLRITEEEALSLTSQLILPNKTSHNIYYVKLTQRSLA